MTLPRFVVGFTGHRDARRLGDLERLCARLRAELPATVPAGTELVSGLADGGDALMVRLWRELDLGPVTGIPGLFVNAGFGAAGLTMAPVAGQALAELILTGSSTVDLGPFGPGDAAPPGPAAGQ